MSLPSNFVTQEVRLAIYIRHDFKCQFCNKEIERDVRALSLDHLQARSKAGEKSNPKNLVCACNECNRKKGNKTLSEFAKELGIHHIALKKRIKKQVSKQLDIKAAKRAIRQHGYRTAILVL